MIKNISVLGSTGSIGTQTLDVVDKLNLNVTALTANSNVKLTEQQIRKYKPQIAVLFDEEKAKELQLAVKDTNTKVLGGMDGLIAAATEKSCELVLNSVVGMVGLLPTIAAANAKKDIALANKETLVAGGHLVTDAVRDNNVRLLPVDSEHSAIFQCLQGMPQNKALKKLILTASGGPFFGRTRDELKDVTVEQALNHPNWSMGAKITIDSASMMNKGLEIIEASRLFDVEGDRIDVVVHRESIIHSLVEYDDNSVIAQLGLPDMRIPIQYAVTYPDRYESPVGELKLADIAKMTFFEPDYKTFECLTACKKALDTGGTATAVVNGANEEANALFRQGKISFLEIGSLVTESLNAVKTINQKNVEDAKQALVTCKEIVSRYDVNMQLTNCEYTLDKAKVIFMYTSDDRVDFRELLKELAVVFKCRIELRQIGPRDKAKVIGGIGTCGLPLCCSTLLGEFNGVSINMAKNQMLAINIEKISGACGRLMCCLKYEDEIYSLEKERFPKIGSRVKYQDKDVKVTGLNVINDLVKIETNNGIVFVGLDEIKFDKNNHAGKKNGKPRSH